MSTATDVSLSPHTDSPSRHKERAARIAWSTIVEPGDRDATRLIAAVGAHRALTLLKGDFPEVALAPWLSPDIEGYAAEVVKRWSPRLNHNQAGLAARQGARFDMKVLIPGDPDWPTQLDDLADHVPLLLWCRGDVSLLTEPKRVAIVGARAATGYGQHVAVEFASGLSDRGFTIVSGGAYGVDGTAHRATLSGEGKTIVALAGGIDRWYPSGHEGLFTRVLECGGLIVAEVPPGTSPTKWRFLLRNRIIAALAQATVVVEAGWRSGSLNTAGHAATIGRPVGAVPGPITSAASAGCHRLLREFGATCVTTVDEVVALIS